MANHQPRNRRKGTDSKRAIRSTREAIAVRGATREQPRFWAQAIVPELRQLIEEDGESVKHVAERFGKSQDSVRQAMSRFGIRVKVRRHGKAPVRIERSAKRPPAQRDRFDRLWTSCREYIEKAIAKAPSGADDILSDVLKIAWLDFDKFEDRGKGSFNAWIMAIAKRTLSRHKEHSGVALLDPTLDESLLEYALDDCDQLASVSVPLLISELASAARLSLAERDALQYLLDGKGNEPTANMLMGLRRGITSLVEGTTLALILSVYRQEVHRGFFKPEGAKVVTGIRILCA